MKNLFHGISAILILMIMVCLLAGCATASGGGDTATEMEVMTETAESGLLKIRFFEVKNSDASSWGDSTYIEFPDGRNMIIDFGGSGAGAEIAGYLKAEGITYIDYAVFSHCHSDHVNGFTDFLNAGIGFGHAMTNDYIPTNYAWMAARFSANGMDTTVLNAGYSFDIGEVHFTVLSPFPEDLDYANLGRTNAADSGTGSNRDINDSSIVLKMTYGDFSALFTGDIYTDQEARILDAYRDNPEILDVDVMKLMHHGKDTSGSSEWIAATSPKLAVAEGLFSVSASKCMEYLDAGASDIYFTWMNGNVYVTSDGNGFEYHADRPEMTGSYKGLRALYEYKKAQQEAENK
ncbi:MAG: MBL fold metallo-hydrolase [Spirochaetales bacterium]|nr:MBL fold metallo-hydrolase [Spirochaetales bacterium]